MTFAWALFLSLFPEYVRDVERVHRRALLRQNFRHGNIQLQFREHCAML